MNNISSCFLPVKQPESKHFLDAGKRILPLVATGEVNRDGHTHRIVLQNVADISIHIRKERLVGFFSEGFNITFSPQILVAKCVDKALTSLYDKGIGLYIISGVPLCIGSVILCSALTFVVPFTFAAAVIFEVGRTIHYGLNHMTIEVENQKYYVNTKQYKTLLNDSFQIPAKELSTSVGLAQYRKGRKLLDLADERIHNILHNNAITASCRNELNREVRDAFNSSDYQTVCQLIQFGANPNLTFGVELPNGYIYGCLFGLVHKELVNNQGDASLQNLLTMLETRIPRELQQTAILEFDLGMPTTEVMGSRLNPPLIFGPMIVPPEVEAAILVGRIQAARDANEINRIFTHYTINNPQEMRERLFADERFASIEGDLYMNYCEIGTLGAFLNQLVDANPSLAHFRQDNAGNVRHVRGTMLRL